MDNLEINPAELTTEKEALKTLTELREFMNSFKQDMEELTSHEKEVKAEKQELEKEYRDKAFALNEREKAFREKLFEARNQFRKVSKQVESVERRYYDIQLAERLESELLVLEDRWDAMTIGAPWREWAKDHQLQGAKRVTFAQKMIVGDTMGLGKTLTSIIALDLIKASTADAREDNIIGGMPEMTQVYNSETEEYELKEITKGGVSYPCGDKVLYFCPSTMLKNVEREIRQWAPHRNVVVLGGLPKSSRRFALEIMQENNQYVVVLNYEAWRKDKQLIQDLIDIKFDTVIIDEAHNIKDRQSIAYRGVKSIIDRSNIPFVIPMTGTPILNKPQELFSLLTLVNPDRFRSENTFLRDFCEQYYQGNSMMPKWRFREGGLAKLGELIRGNFIRRTKEDAGIILPPKTVIVHELEVDEDKYPEQSRARNEMRKWGSIILDADSGKAISASAVIAMYTRLRQIETWPAGIELKDQHGDVVLRVDIKESQKIDEIIRPNGPLNSYADPEGLLPEIIADERAVIFSQFKTPLQEIKRRCDEAGIRSIVLDGDTPTELRDEIALDFDNKYVTVGEHKWDVVLCNYRVGGVGMNLTAATQMIILDEEWNPGKRDQAYDRIHRIGQDKPVTIHVLRDKGTVDGWLSGLISAKEDIVDGFNAVTEVDMTEDFIQSLKNGLI